eukprot:1345852-Rhodomonas_salina.1
MDSVTEFVTTLLGRDICSLRRSELTSLMMVRMRDRCLALPLVFALGSLSNCCAFVSPLMNTRGCARHPAQSLSFSPLLSRPLLPRVFPHLGRAEHRPQSSLRCSGQQVDAT